MTIVPLRTLLCTYFIVCPFMLICVHYCIAVVAVAVVVVEIKCGCIRWMLFRNLSCLDTIIYSMNTIGIVPAYACTVCDAMVASYATTD